MVDFMSVVHDIRSAALSHSINNSDSDDSIIIGNQDEWPYPDETFSSLEGIPGLDVSGILTQAIEDLIDTIADHDEPPQTAYIQPDSTTGVLVGTVHEDKRKDETPEVNLCRSKRNKGPSD